ncbi:MAG TPA: hypothetical protein VGR13_05520 [Actinomycetota bacterium]|jgi:hypothetical protein|nr:hypothetical protein [Actinomycetota bacterium]
MNRARAFERYWAEFERPLRPAEESLPPAPEVAGAVATATALRQYAEAVPVMDLDSTWQGLVARLETREEVPAADAGAEAGRNGQEEALGTVVFLRPKLRWTARAAVAAVAAVVALSTVSLRASPGTALYPVRLTVERAALALSPRDRAIHLRVAEARLDDLLVSLREGPVHAARGLARSLVVNRAAAGRAGADLSDLDLRISLEVPPALQGVPPSIASAVRTILGDLLPPEQSSAQGPQLAPGSDDQGNEDKGGNEETGRRGEGSGQDSHDEGREHQGRGEADDHQGEDKDSDQDSDSNQDSGDGDSDSGKGSGDDESGDQYEGSGQGEQAGHGDSPGEGGSDQAD